MEDLKKLLTYYDCYVSEKETCKKLDKLSAKKIKKYEKLKAKSSPKATRMIGEEYAYKISSVEGNESVIEFQQRYEQAYRDCLANPNILVEIQNQNKKLLSKAQRRILEKLESEAQALQRG